MASEEPELVAGKLCRPRQVEGGEVLHVDTGFERTIVLKVRREGEIYYETYVLTNVESEDEIVS